VLVAVGALEMAPIEATPLYPTFDTWPLWAHSTRLAPGSASSAIQRRECSTLSSGERDILPVATATKGKRRIVVAEREYYWRVGRDSDHPFRPGERSIYVGSYDLEFIVRYPLFQPSERRHIIVIGPELASANAPGPPRRFRCPRFGDENIVYPSAIRELIDWCQDSRGWREPVDEHGQLVGS
jgi:hypothetical protein